MRLRPPCLSFLYWVAAELVFRSATVAALLCLLTEPHAGAEPITVTAESTAPPVVKVPLSIRSGVPAIRAKVNGVDLWMVIDTGSQHCSLDPDSAKSVGLRPSPGSPASLRVQGASGERSAHASVIGTLVIGEWTLRNVPCTIAVGAFRASPGVSLFQAKPRLDLLGMQALGGFCSALVLDPASKEATFIFSSASVPKPSSKALRIPLEMRGGLPFTPVSAGSASWSALLDTAAACSVEVNETQSIPPELISRAYASRERRGGFGGLSERDHRAIRFTLAELRAGEVTIQNLQVSGVPDISKIGFGFLKQWRSTFDFVHRQAWLE